MIPILFKLNNIYEFNMSFLQLYFALMYLAVAIQSNTSIVKMTANKKYAYTGRCR
jgi:hypothetical protein